MTDQPPLLSPRGDRAAIEDGDLLMPAFDAAGLITAVAVRAGTGEVLMVAHMNREALERTLTTRQAWYWSRSRRELWLKGATSGQIQHVRDIRVDCDQDCLLLVVDVGGDGGCCHTGRPDCFYRSVILPAETGSPVRLVARFAS
jgi:phosphoribosyl-AMP cyclohydrolase